MTQLLIKEITLVCIRRRKVDDESLNRNLEDDGLRTFFSTPRLVQPGEVLSIPLSLFPTPTAGRRRGEGALEYSPTVTVPPFTHVAVLGKGVHVQRYLVQSCRYFSPDNEDADLDAPAGATAALTKPGRTRVILSGSPSPGQARNAALPSVAPSPEDEWGVDFAAAHAREVLGRLLPGSPCLLGCSSIADSRLAVERAAFMSGSLCVVVPLRLALLSHTQRSSPSSPAPPAPPPAAAPAWGGARGAGGAVFVKAAAECSPAALMALQPCILLLEGLDECVAAATAAAAAGAGAGVVGEDGADQLSLSTAALSRWLSSLSPSPSSLHSRQAQAQGQGQGQGGVLVAAHSTSPAHLPGALRALFPSDLALSCPANNAHEASVGLARLLSPPRFVPSSSDRGTGLVYFSSQAEAGAGAGAEEEAEAVKVVLRESKAAGGTSEALGCLASEASLAALRRHRGHAWLTALTAAEDPGLSLSLGLGLGLGEGGGGGTDQSEEQDRRGEMTSAEGGGAALGWVSVLDAKAACRDCRPCLSSSSSSSGSSSSPAAAPIAEVRWADIGGLERVRKEILDVVQLPLLRPELFPPGCPVRRAVLLYGPPGTGKTLVAKAVATECDMSFLSVKGPELLDMYVGESERNVREVFAQARARAPCVVFFDELDSLAPARGRSSDAGGVMDRVVSQLLTELDSLSSPPALASASPAAEGANAVQAVFVLGATNRPDLLDGALLRPGRFDRRVYLGVCSDAGSRLNIMQAQTRHLNLDAGADLARLAAFLPSRVTGADIGAVVSAAFAQARNRTIAALKAEAEASAKAKAKAKGRPEGKVLSDAALSAFVESQPAARLAVVVSAADLEAAAAAVRMTVSEEELARFEELRRQFESSLPSSS